MKFLFVSGLKHLPQAFGGVQSNAHEMALELIKGGHSVAMAAELEPFDPLGRRTRIRGKLGWRKTVHDQVLGYPVYRRWVVREALADIVRAVRPDVALLQPAEHISLARELNRLGVPLIVYLHDVLFDEYDGDPRELRDTLFMANSEFTARRCKEEFGIDPTVAPPLFRSERYRAEVAPENVTMINPIPVKGRDVMLRLVVACPDIPFNLIPSWDISSDKMEVLTDHLARCPNLTLSASTMDMKDVYARAKVVLAPSILDEAWGRVATEAQFSGIPVIASNRGGLPQAVGPGGVLLDPDGPIEPWIEALRRLWFDEAHYAEVSAAALAYSRRPELDPGNQIRTLLEVAHEAIALTRAAPPRAVAS